MVDNIKLNSVIPTTPNSKQSTQDAQNTPQNAPHTQATNPTSSGPAEKIQSLGDIVEQLTNLNVDTTPNPRVAEIKAAIEQGRYTVDNQQVANDLLNEYFPEGGRS